LNGRELIVLTDVVLITCVIRRGAGDEIVRAAQEAGARGAFIQLARGPGVQERLGAPGLYPETEKEIVTVIAATEQAEQVFERMYAAGRLDTPGTGFIYATPLEKVATYLPPGAVPDR
jgi:nitrogen regulatory protein PII